MIYLYFLVYLLLTIFIEGVVVWLLFKDKAELYYSFLVNLLTNPTLNLLLLLTVYYWGVKFYLPVLFLLEVLVVIVEAWVYNYLNHRGFSKMLKLSIGLNSLSFIVGLVINKLLF